MVQLLPCVVANRCRTKFYILAAAKLQREEIIPEGWICRVLDGRHSNLAPNLKVNTLHQCSGFHDGNYSSDHVVVFKHLI